MLFIEDHLHDFTYAMLSLNKSKVTGFFFFSVGKGRQLLHMTHEMSLISVRFLKLFIYLFLSGVHLR